jgi:hypothetical protein
MGGAFTAVANDGNAVFYNPAGLRTIPKAEIDFVYARPFAGLKGVDLWTGTGIMAYNLNTWGNVGLSWTETSVQTLYQERTLALSYAHGVAVHFGRLDGQLLAGANLRQLSYGFSLDARTQSDPVFRNGDTRSETAFDLGFLYRHGARGRFRTGLFIRDLNEPNLGFVDQVRQDRSYRFGFAYQTASIPHVPFDIMPSFDFEVSRDRKEYSLGVEAWHVSRVAALRTGASLSDGHFRDTSAGLSWVFASRRGMDFQLDYVFIVPLQFRESSGSHSMGLGIKFK